MAVDFVAGKQKRRTFVLILLFLLMISGICAPRVAWRRAAEGCCCSFVALIVAFCQQFEWQNAFLDQWRDYFLCKWQKGKSLCTSFTYDELNRLNVSWYVNTFGTMHWKALDRSTFQSACLRAFFIVPVQVIERNAQPEMTLLGYLRNHCILWWNADDFNHFIIVLRYFLMPAYFRSIKKLTLFW